MDLLPPSCRLRDIRDHPVFRLFTRLTRSLTISNRSLRAIRLRATQILAFPLTLGPNSEARRRLCSPGHVSFGDALQLLLSSSSLPDFPHVVADATLAVGLRPSTVLSESPNAVRPSFKKGVNPSDSRIAGHIVAKFYTFSLSYSSVCPAVGRRRRNCNFLLWGPRAQYRAAERWVLSLRCW